MSEFQKIYMSKLLCKCSFRTNVIVDITGEEEELLATGNFTMFLGKEI